MSTDKTTGATPFAQVLRTELADVALRRDDSPGPSEGAHAGQEAPATPAAPAAGTTPVDPAAELRQARAQARDMDLVGLALSGGGIRSATFCLGILQGLADLGLLKRVDYLSTVSGGGYIGGWLAAWIQREGSVLTVERQLRGSRVDQAAGRPDAPRPVEDEPEPLFHLRSFSNYLAPRPGLGSADSWVLLAIYLRNFLLNQSLLLPTMLAALLLPRLLMLFYDWDAEPNRESWYTGLATLTVAILLLASFNIIRSVRRLRAAASGTTGATGGEVTLQTGLSRLNFGVLLPLAAASILVCWFSWDNWDPIKYHSFFDAWGLGWLPRLPNAYLRTALTFGGFFGLLFGALHALYSPLSLGFRLAFRRRVSGASAGGGRWLWRNLWWIFAGVLSGAIGGALLGVLFQMMYRALTAEATATIAREAYEVALVTTVGPPAALLIFVLSTIVQVGLLGRHLDEAEREWWGSLCGWLMIYAVSWAAFSALALFGVPFLLWAGAAVQAALGTGWVAMSVGGVLAGRSPSTGKGIQRKPLEILARVAPAVFVVGLLIALSGLLSVIVDDRPPEDLVAQRVGPRKTPAVPPTRVIEPADGPGNLPLAAASRTREFTEEVDREAVQIERYWAGLFNTHKHPKEVRELRDRDRAKDRPRLFWKQAAWFVDFGTLALLASWCVGVNTFSLHGIYANRLVRCYLGASRPKDWRQTDQLHGKPANTGPPTRRPNPITGFDPNDDLPLRDLRVGRPPSGGAADAPARQRPYRGPYPLFNTALNLVEGDELAWQERKAESFVLAPAYCGSKSTGYRPLPGYGGDVSLGTAVTVSGAAASPNMGYHSSPAVTALLTVFNVRLGAWFGNPRRRTWEQGEPQMSLFLLLKELFGRTNRRSAYVYLSDGGHFDNLGVYELVRRHCRYIIACDGGQDEDYSFDDLGGLIRKCRSDLGVPIEIDVTPIKPQQAGGYSQWHCAIGKIRYDQLDPQAVPGVLVYLKSSLTGNESSDVLNYAVQHRPFPHQTTANQFFTESQFESYRALGQHVAHEVFWEALGGVEQTEEMSDAAHRRVVRRLFSNLHRRWFPPLPRLEESYLESVRACLDLEATLRQDKNLSHFSQTLYPELGPAAATDSGRAEVHAVAEMLRVMENAWLGVHLEGYHAHPLNRGWMNAFRRWVNSEVFRKHWLTLRGEYSQDFIRFCENELRLDRGLARGYPAVGCPEGAWTGLQREFRWEWPTEGALEERVGQAQELSRAGDGVPTAWLVALASATAPHAEVWTEDKYPCGAVLVWAPPDSAEEYELLVWIRGAYRNLGIGRECLRELLPGLLAGLRGLPNRRPVLRVRYPGGARSGGMNKMQKEMWLAFFYEYRFLAGDPPDLSGRCDLVLRRSLS